MEHRTKRDVTLLNIVSDFETNFEKGNDIFYQEKTFLEIIRFYEEELQYEKAIEVADIALDKYSFRSEFYLIKARLLFQTNFHEEALRLLDKAEKISPYEHDILLLKIRILAFQGEVTEASNILLDMKRYVTSGDLSDVYLSESFINEVMQDYQSMYENLAKAIICDKDNEEAFERIGFAVQLSKKYKESIEFHKTIINEHPFNYLAWYNLGHALACEGEYQDAIDAIEYSFLTEPNFENGYLDCADICIQEKCYLRALGIYENYIDKYSLNEEVLINMAECQYELGNHKKARHLLGSLLKMDPYNDEVYYKLGLCYAKANNWNRAISAYHKAITLEDSCEDYYLAMAKAHNAIGSFEKAEFYYGKSVENGTEQSNFWKEYVSFLIKLGKKEKALAILAEADDFTFGADLLFCKGVALYLLGYQKQALIVFEEALKEEFGQHEVIYEIEPEFLLNKDVQSMVSYYEGELKAE